MIDVAYPFGGGLVGDQDLQLQPTVVEMHGILEGSASRSRAVGDIVVVSNFERGSAISGRLNGLTLRYVGRGEEHYRIGGKSFSVGEGQMMICHQQDGAEVDIRKGVLRGTLGLCIFLASNDDREFDELAGPMVMSSSCSPVGALMKRSLGDLLGQAPTRSARAATAVHELVAQVPGLLTEFAAQTDRIQASKRVTRLDALLKVNRARSYLHSMTDRAVKLDELAKVTGVSKFHLLRVFQQCMGESPTSYHRRLRLTLALEEAQRRRVSIDRIANDYGFAGASSFSHTYRRAFGRSPIWTKNAAIR
jgi:AraC-like DNA-binding protein